MRLWIVGKFIAKHTDSLMAWEFMGVFDDEQKAADACRPGYFVGPAQLNEILPDEPSEWPESYYPLG